MMKIRGFVVVVLFASIVPVSASQSLPYAGQEQQEIKTLSAEDIQGYLAGRGMGLAKTAELNHYPGPKHVLEFADVLGLTKTQKEKTEAVFMSMQQNAQRLGSVFVEEERNLDRLFASGTIDHDALRILLDQIGRLQADLRRIHLQAHLEQKAILTEQQIAQYDELRGYTTGTKSPPHDSSHRH